MFIYIVDRDVQLYFGSEQVIDVTQVGSQSQVLIGGLTLISVDRCKINQDARTEWTGGWTMTT